MPAAKPAARLTEYPKDQVWVGRGLMIAVGLHLFVAALICIIVYILGITNLKQLLEQGGSIAESGPAPEQVMEVEMKDKTPPPPPTPHIEFLIPIVKPPPVPVVQKPKPKPKAPVVKLQPHFTAPNATGSGNSNRVSAFRVGTSGFPTPGYPYQALQDGEGGTVQMRVVFGPDGGVENADVISSSGVTILDTSTRNFIYGHWKNESEANKTIEVPIIYDPSLRRVR